MPVIHPSKDDSVRFPFLTVALFLILMAASFSLTLSKNHNDAEDSVSYIRYVSSSDSEGLFHPNHLIYNYVNRGIFKVWQSAGYQGNALLSMQSLNVLASLGTLAIFAFIGWRLGLTRSQVLLSMTLLVSCFGYWWYSVEAEAYLLPLPFALTAWYQTSRFIQSGGHGRLIWAALCVAIAILIHQQWMALFAGLGLGLLIHWWQSRKFATQEGILTSIFVAGGVTISIVTLIYLIVIFGHFSINSSKDVLAWMSGEQFNVQIVPWSNSNPLKAIVGALRAVWGGHFLFGFTELQEAFIRLFPNKLLVEEIFLAEATHIMLRWFCVITSIVALLAAFPVMRAVFSGVTSGQRQRNENRKGFVLTGALTILMFFILNTIVEPTNSELYIGILPMAIILLLTRLGSSKKARSGELSLWVFTVSLLLTNLTGSIFPQTDRKHDYWYAANRYLINEPTQSDLVISEGGYINDGYLRLFSKAQIERGVWMSESRIEELRQEFRNGRTFISSWAFKPPAGLGRQLDYYDPEAVSQRFTKFKLTEVEKNPYQTIYLVE